HDLVPRQDLITSEEARSLGNLVAQAQLQGRKHRKPVSGAPADITRLREQSPGKGTETRRDERVGTCLRDAALDLDHLMGCPHSELARHIQEKVLQLDAEPAAELTSVKLILGRKRVVEIGHVAEQQ